MFRDILNKYIITYLDDILVYSSKILEDYIGKIHEVLRYFDKRNLRLKPKKYCFHQKEVKFLGYIIGRDRIYVDPRKIISIKE